MLAEKFSARANFNLHGDFSFRKKKDFPKRNKENEKKYELTFRRAVDSGGSELVVVCAE